MSSFTDQSPNMMEVISPEIGLPKFDAVITSDEMTMQYDTANGSSLEYLTPDLPTGKFFNFGTSFDNTEISPRTSLNNTGTSPADRAISPNNTGTSPNSTGDNPNNTGTSTGGIPNNTGTSPNSTGDNPNDTGTSTPPDLYDRVKTLAETIKQEIDSLRDDRRNVPLHPQQDKQQQQQQTTTNNNNNNDNSDNNNKSDNVDVMEEKIRKALVKMKKLDSKLAQVIKKEKEVKGRRSRQAHTIQSDISLDDSQLVFRTQPLEGNEIINVECIETDSYSNETDSCTNQNENESITSDGSSLQHGKSFIQRNKELASEKGDILLTETERQRLEELLNEEEDVQVIINNDNGYCYTDQERIQVDKIDRALQNIIPSTGSLVINNSSSILTINKGCGPGEEVLASLQWERSEQLRLKEINDQLSLLQQEHQQQYNDKEDAVDFGYNLTEDQLAMLLEQYNNEKLDTYQL